MNIKCCCREISGAEALYSARWPLSVPGTDSKVSGRHIGTAGCNPRYFVMEARCVRWDLSIPVGGGGRALQGLITCRGVCYQPLQRAGHEPKSQVQIPVQRDP